VRRALIEEADRLDWEQKRPIVEGLGDLYAMQHFAFSTMLHYLGIFKGDQTIYGELEKSKNRRQITSEEQRKIDDEILRKLQHDGALRQRRWDNAE